MKIEINTDNDPFMVPVSIAGRMPFRVQLHRLLTKTSAVDGPSMAAAVREVAIPPEAAAGCTEDELAAVYWQASDLLKKAQAAGNG